MRKNLALLILLAGFFAGAFFVVADARASETFAVDTVEIETRRGSYTFTVEMAVTWAQRAQGLQRRRVLADDRGMLFDYGEPQNITMWMKNTYISLDMLFIGADGRVVSMARNTTPLSFEHIPSGWPVRAVLEVPAGTLQRLGVQGGDTVRHAVFGNVTGDADQGERP